MRRPNFFIVGAPRCGTTSMYSYLRQHPEIHVSVHKEPHFFGSDLTPLPGAIREEALYLELFAGAGDRPRAGESSVWYLLSEKAAGEIHAYAPEARIIILLRNPQEMVHSLHSLYTRTGNEDLPGFAEALAAEPERRAGRRIPPGAYFPEGLLYTGVGRYAAQVERYFTAFGRENVLCILFDDMVRDTAAVYRQALEHLGVDPRFEAELDPGRAGERARMQAIRQLTRTSPEVRRRLQFKDMRQHEGGPRSPLPAADAARLRDLFAEDVARLGALLGRDLGAWTRGERLSGRREARAVDDEALVGPGADHAGGSRDLDLEAEQAALRHLHQPDADRDLLARPGGADMADVDMGADGGLPRREKGLDGGEAGVLDQADHARGREDALQVGGSHVGSDPVDRLMGQAAAEHVGGHDG